MTAWFSNDVESTLTQWSIREKRVESSNIWDSFEAAVEMLNVNSFSIRVASQRKDAGFFFYLDFWKKLIFGALLLYYFNQLYNM